MAKEIIKEEKQEEKTTEKKMRGNAPKVEEATLVRILGKDVRGDKKVRVGLTKIRGVSWSFSNAVCRALKMDSERKVSELSENEIKTLEEFMRNPSLPKFLKNRQKDFDEGVDKHITGADLKLRHEFDIKRLKKIKCYRGVRHSNNQPVRGQRTKAHFRTNRKKSGAVGVKK
jgi:small subunit ribosomal protein S13